MWKSYEEYKERIYPVALDNSDGYWREMGHQSLVERTAATTRLVDNLRASVGELNSLWQENAEIESEGRGKAWELVLTIGQEVEELFMYCEPLARSDAAYEMRHQKDLFEHWERYRSGRLKGRVPEFIKATNDFLVDVAKYFDKAGRFIDPHIRDLPETVLPHFERARDLFSVECDELGAFSALRGLEAILREIFRKQHVKIERPRKNGANRQESLYDADLHDLIVAVGFVQWSGEHTPILNRSELALLHYLRVSRNATAHGLTAQEVDNWREIALQATRYAAHLWVKSKGGKRRIMDKLVRLGG